MLEVQDLSVSLPGRQLLAAVGFQCNSGDILALAGPNGAGKSTLLKTLAGITSLSGGYIKLDGIDASRMTPRDRAAIVGWQPQRPSASGFLRVDQAVELGMMANPDSRASIAQVLTDFELTALKNRKLSTLSGGELGRVMLARLVAGQPKVYLLDEPLAAQDPYYQLMLLDYFISESSGGKLVVMALHDLYLLYRACNKTLVLENGKQEFFGDTAELADGKVFSKVYKVDVELAGNPARPTIGFSLAGLKR